MKDITSSAATCLYHFIFVHELDIKKQDLSIQKKIEIKHFLNSFGRGGKKKEKKKSQIFSLLSRIKEKYFNKQWKIYKNSKLKFNKNI